nr:hypothetical protein [uncultured Hyphomonas sp.]
MVKLAKKEDVSVSFHYLCRLKEKGDPSKGIVPFTEDEFNGVYGALTEAKKLDMNDPETIDRIRRKRVAPIIKAVRDSPTTISGLFKASSYGHSFENNVKGDIPAESINLRPFFFQLYLSKSGRIYIASQYLGLYGGYLQIRNTVLSALPGSSSIDANSFNVAHIDLKDVEIREIEFAFSKKGNSLHSKNVFGKRGSFALHPQNGDQKFGREVRTKLLKGYPYSNAAQIKKSLTGLLKESDLLDLKDEDIDACRVLVRSNKKDRYIHLIAGIDFATRFPVDVPKNDDGHPKYEPLKDKVTKLLKDEIVAKKENV